MKMDKQLIMKLQMLNLELIDNIANGIESIREAAWCGSPTDDLMDMLDALSAALRTGVSEVAQGILDTLKEEE